MPMVSPDEICKLTSFRIILLVPYLKSTWSKSMEPSFTSITGFTGLVRVLFSFNTSQIRTADSADIVNIT